MYRQDMRLLARGRHIWKSTTTVGDLLKTTSPTQTAPETTDLDFAQKTFQASLNITSFSWKIQTKSSQVSIVFCLSVYKPEVNAKCLPQLLLTFFFFNSVPSLNLALIVLARLVGQWAVGILLSLQPWGCVWVSSVHDRDSNSSPHAGKASTLPTKPPPSLY